MNPLLDELTLAKQDLSQACDTNDRERIRKAYRRVRDIRESMPDDRKVTAAFNRARTP